MENETTLLLCDAILGRYNRILYASCYCKNGKQKMKESEKSGQQYISPCNKANLLLLFALSMNHWPFFFPKHLSFIAENKGLGQTFTIPKNAEGRHTE